MGKSKGSRGAGQRAGDDDWEADAAIVEATVDPEAAVAAQQRAELEAQRATQRSEYSTALSAELQKEPLVAREATLEELLDGYTALKSILEKAASIKFGQPDDAAASAAAAAADEHQLLTDANLRLDALIAAADARISPAVEAAGELACSSGASASASSKRAKGKKGRKGKKRADSDDDWEEEADILDVCDGSDGEATSAANKRAALASARVAALAKAKAEKDEAAGGYKSMRGAYDEIGAEAYYECHGEEYSNPHEPLLAAALRKALDAWRPTVVEEGPLQRGLDLSCGSGEASAAFGTWDGSAGCELEASDPYTYAAYEKRFPGKAAFRWSFADIAGGVLDERPPYDIVMSSFALHLIEPSFLFTTLAALARSARLLVVLTPHKRPVIDASTGWRGSGELVHERVRVRLYVSDNARRE
jgi:hypothetical protein